MRIIPEAPPQAFKTYQIVRPVSTHWRKATCKEANCSHYLNGWKTTIDESTELGQRQAHYIRSGSGRGFTEQKNESGLTEFLFEPGQDCFNSADHKVALEREPRYFIKDGDWRGNPLGTKPRELGSFGSWVDEFAEHQDFLTIIRERG